MKTAAAFAKGFLELEGELPPILVSLVRKEKVMLDQSGNKNIKKNMDQCKVRKKMFFNFEFKWWRPVVVFMTCDLSCSIAQAYIKKIMDINRVLSDEEIRKFVPTQQQSVMNALKAIRIPKNGMEELLKLMSGIVQQLERLVLSGKCCLQSQNVGTDSNSSHSVMDNNNALPTPLHKCFESPNKNQNQEVDVHGLGSSLHDVAPAMKNPAHGETLLLMLDRWRKLHKDFYNEKKGGFNITKIPDVHDAARYDCLHNSHISLVHLPDLYEISKTLADCVVPQEYGIDVDEKLLIGSKMCSALMEKIKYDLIIARSDNKLDTQYRLDESHAEDLTIKSVGRQVRTRLYFTSESHLQTLMNVLRYPVDGLHQIVSPEAKEVLDRTEELCYLTSFVIRLYEDPKKYYGDPARFRVEVLFSPGIVQHPLQSKGNTKAKPLTLLNKNLSCAQIEEMLDAAISLAAMESLHDAAHTHKERINTLALDKAPQTQRLSQNRAKESMFPGSTKAKSTTTRSGRQSSDWTGIRYDNHDYPDTELLQQKPKHLMFHDDDIWEVERRNNLVGLGLSSMTFIMAATVVGAGITFLALRKKYI